MNRLLTMVEAAERLDVSKRTVQKLVTAGDLPAVRISRIVRIRPEDLDAFVAGRVVSKKTVRR